MDSVKDIKIKIIPAQEARKFIKRHHYSGSVAQNSCLHFGAFWEGYLHGVLQFGPPLDKRKSLTLVKNTGWNDFLELNRLAFDSKLPKNSESRSIAVAIKLIKKNAPHIKWIISYADGTQCGDGTIYRASGFYLTGIKKNTTTWEAPDGKISTDLSLRLGAFNKKIVNRTTVIQRGHCLKNSGAASMKNFKEAGYKPKKGFQLRYIYFIDKKYKNNLTVPILPFSKIKEMKAGMYKGEARN